MCAMPKQRVLKIPKPSPVAWLPSGNGADGRSVGTARSDEERNHYSLTRTAKNNYFFPLPLNADLYATQDA